MSIENGFIQLPPDSTGKKSAAAGRLIIDFTNELQTIRPGDLITGVSSGATGTVVGIAREGYAEGDGQLYVEVVSSTGTFVTGEDLNVSAVLHATVAATATLDEIFYQKGVIVDRNTPNRSLGIDDRGAAKITFSDGQPSLSSFGGLLTDEPSVVRQYVHAYDALDPEFYSASGETGGYSYLPDERAVLLDTNGVASGAFVQRTSHFYHTYQAGTSTRCLMSIACGDTGKASVVRRWGLYDDENGFFWELNGTTFSAVIRSNTTGSVVDTKVSQSDFNKDKIDGDVRFDLDVSKANLYFIDYQWLGVGVANFGVYESDGTKTTAHTFENPNTLTAPYTRQGTLPIRNEIINSGVAGSSSELKFICGAVYALGKTTVQSRSRSFITDARNISSSDGAVPLLTLRPKQTVNGLRNSIIGLIDHFEVFNCDAKAVKVTMKQGTFVDGAASFVDVDPAYSVEIDQSASGYLATTNQLACGFAPSGQSHQESVLKDNDSFQNDVGTILLADGVTQPGISIDAEVLGGGSTDVYVAIHWKEVVQ